MKGTLFEIGRYFGFIKNLFYKPEKLPVYVRQVFREMVNLGIGSLWLVALTSAFMGAVITI
ncbi:MAG TPA: ABC transporter permease, partial [Bacteroidia bacterium]|nr:ABC transporter permease [Bacteroidia bacterium]